MLEFTFLDAPTRMDGETLIYRQAFHEVVVGMTKDRPQLEIHEM